uniref:SUEL-type lectin domain-containing protein n=1 Tax=Spongospora subterranea TaxID=70186 RepID=A0A0H5RDP0_9EUKA|eukprot:CRZ11682.1 hypothetical protein [Spongospora subterranea]
MNRCFEQKTLNQGKLLKCPHNQVVKGISRAHFGLQLGSCSHGNTWKQVETCSKDIKPIVSRMCLDRESCYVEADPKEFGIPCQSKENQFRVMVDYICGQPDEIKPKCFNSEKNSAIICPTGQVITSFTKGSFGNPGTCSAPFKTGDCHVDPLPLLQSQCLRQNRCDVNVMTAKFGTPSCGNATYGNSSKPKFNHLLTEYTCGLPTDTALNLTRYNVSAFDKTLLKKKANGASGAASGLLALCVTILAMVFI